MNAISKVNGTQVANDTFAWNGNAGQMRMELGSVQTSVIDNLMIATIPEPTSAALIGMFGVLARVFQQSHAKTNSQSQNSSL